MKLSVFCLLVLVLSGACAGTAKNEARLAEAIKIQGEAFLMQGDYTAALSRLLEARKMQSEDPYLLNSLGLAYMGKNRDDLAIPEFKTALKLKPDYTEALNNLGAAHLRRKEWDQAIPLFKQVLEDLLYPTPQFPLSNLGWAYLEKQNYLLAETYFSQALDISPEFVTAVHGQARVLLETRRETQAVKFIKARLLQNPEAAILHADLARAYEAKGWTSEAENAWRNVLRYAKENTELKKTAAERLSGPD